MSHVDDGTLHAYLDGELTPVERERLEGHFAACEACRARREEARALIERAGRLLGLATPPERAAPPLHELRRPHRGRGFMIPLAWAATVTLAIGLGWYARGASRTFRTAGESAQARLDTATPVASPPATRSDEPAPDQLAASPTASPPPAGLEAVRRDQSHAPAPVVDSAASRGALAEREEADLRARTVPAPPPAAKSLQVRGAAAPSAAAGNVLTVPSDALKDAATPQRAAAWPVIEPHEARDHLGEAPGVIPGVAVTGLRRNPADSSEIVVEQHVGSGMVWLFERRNDAAGRGERQAQGYISNERLARYVRSLRIEIEGSLSADSLSALLGLVR